MHFLITAFKGQFADLIGGIMCKVIINIQGGQNNYLERLKIRRIWSQHLGSRFLKP